MDARMTPQQISKKALKKQAKKISAEPDFLDIDSPIPSQRYALVSFLSPENNIKQRYLWYIEKFFDYMAENLRKKLHIDIDKKKSVLSNQEKDFIKLQNVKETLEKKKKNEFDKNKESEKFNRISNLLDKVNRRLKQKEQEKRNTQIEINTSVNVDKKMKYDTRSQAILDTAINGQLSYGKIKETWKDFLYENGQKLSEYYDENVQFQTSIRGFKIRGSYPTKAEADQRARALGKKDKKHNIFICEIGSWCPWHPSTEEIPNTEYQNKELNTLMKQKRKTKMEVDEFYNERKEEKLKKALNQGNIRRATNEEKKKLKRARDIAEEKDKIFDDLKKKKKEKELFMKQIEKMDLKEFQKIKEELKKNKKKDQDDLAKKSQEVGKSDLNDLDEKVPSNIPTTSIKRKTETSLKIPPPPKSDKSKKIISLEESSKMITHGGLNRDNMVGVFEEKDPWLQRKERQILENKLKKESDSKKPEVPKRKRGRPRKTKEYD